ncbi:hypothetical protein TNCT_605611 [Trichonephila clavata]|uniref:Uncharacterized protein n=1 Tax=Trichonephila clavata TaxID=2740835 RepID=A0A8X6EY19_TRICU|nr:hypothetical protein TNCT_605611 [Trichonephila clavata]
MNPQSSAFQRAVLEAHENNSMLMAVLSTQYRRINKFGINLQQNSKKNLRVLNSIDRSTIVFKESNNIDKENLDKKGVNISQITENELVAHNKISASNSSLKNSYVDSEKTSKNLESFRSFLNNKMNPIQGVFDSKKNPDLKQLKINQG